MGPFYPILLVSRLLLTACSLRLLDFKLEGLDINQMVVDLKPFLILLPTDTCHLEVNKDLNQR